MERSTRPVPLLLETGHLAPTREEPRCNLGRCAFSARTPAPSPERYRRLYCQLHFCSLDLIYRIWGKGKAKNAGAGGMVAIVVMGVTRQYS